MKRTSIQIQLTCLSLAIATQIYAQEPTTQKVENTGAEVKSLAPIVVTATRSAKSISDIAGTVYRIERSEIEKQANAGKNIADILGLLVPSLTPNTGTTSNYGMSMRGRVVQYMIDGIPQTGSRDGSRQLNSILPSMIDRIEVVSGATSIYGSGATGGIINIITKKGGDEALSFETKLGLTSGNNFKGDALAYEASQNVSFNQDRIKGNLGVGYAKRGEIQDSRGDRIGPEVAQTDRQDTQTLDVNGQLTWDISDQQHLTVGAQYYNDEQDSDYGPDYGQGLAVLFRGATPSLKALKGLQLEDQPRTKRWSTHAQYNHNDVLGQSLTLEAYYRKEQARWFPTAVNLLHPELPDGRIPVVMQSNTDINIWGSRLALQKDFKIADRALGLSYGLDFENEKNGQEGQMYDNNTFIASNGLNHKATKIYAMGPDVQVAKLGAFVQANYAITDRINIQAGVRHERINSDVSDSTPYPESIVVDLIPSYTAKSLKGGEVKHNATLFNLGGVYHLSDTQQVFANFSQGFSIPDVQRMLRDVPASFVVTSNNIDPVKVNNYELGWRLQEQKGLNLGLTAFYNDSDKSVRFNAAPNFNIEVIDTDERIYGLEANVKYAISDMWNMGGTIAYTRGQFKNILGDWQELDAVRVAPLKGTLFSEWQFADDINLRVQTLAIGGTDKAAKDYVNPLNDRSSRKPAEIKGFAIMDVITSAKAGPGRLGFGVYNVWNTDYKSVFSQAVAPTYGAISSLAAQGRTYGLSYTLKY
ncbi:MAG: TonB-dependent receptor [Acinetobacter guillouiae]|uniref:TonB-dependent receptor n=1 Tax=Acinetobacter guillouiae TaxID=106649 RepID=UPI001CD1AAD4|nr:TonB-dependent receptor [Acinetobacter guillouiae]